MTLPDAPAEKKGSFQAVNCFCECGFRFFGKASDTPRYCGKCGQMLKVGAFELRGKLRVLLVDDSKLIRRVVRQVLEEMECEVREANDGRDALEKAKLHPCDLVLTDLMMPEMDGRGLIEALRGDPELASIPVGVLSSKGDASTIRDILRQNVLAYILKDQMNVPEFKAHLREFLVAASRLIASRVKRRVVVAEDGNVLRQALTRMLEKMGCEVVPAVDGQDALEKMLEKRPDLLLTDVEMPRMSGIELLKTMRSHERLRDTPVVMLTSLSGSDVMLDAMSEGVRAYIVKDQTNPGDLRRQLEQHIAAAPVSS